MDYIATMEEVILDWLGNIARQTDEKFPEQFLTTWIMNPRNKSGQKHTLCDYSMTTINWMLTYNGVDTKPSKECPSKAWIPLAKEMGQWKSLLVYKHQND
jgi:hypothetical protein